MLKAVLKDASGFKTGMGIQLYDDKHNQGWDVTTAIIRDIQDNTIYFDNRTVNDYLSSLNGTITNSFSVIEAVDVENVKVNEFNGDSFSWQINENITLRGCEASNGDGLGYHPGTGSGRAVVKHTYEKEYILRSGNLLIYLTRISLFLIFIATNPPSLRYNGQRKLRQRSFYQL